MMIGIDLSKQQAKVIQQTNVTGNLDQAGGATMFFIIEETKETKLDFPIDCKSIVILFCFNMMLIHNDTM